MYAKEPLEVPIDNGRGLMSAPKVLLIDEPSLGLSPLFVQENFKVIQRINEQGVSVFLVEQNVRQTLRIAHYGYVLAQGRVFRIVKAPSAFGTLTDHWRLPFTLPPSPKKFVPFSPRSL